MTNDSDKRYQRVMRMLTEHGQQHVLKFYGELSEGEQSQLLEQIEAIDFGQMDRLIETYVRSKPVFEVPGGLEPAPFFAMPPAPEGGAVEQYAAAKAAGERLLREGKVAAMVVAGGSGTRLGWNGPKGTYPAGPVSGKPLFELFAEQIRGAMKKFGSTIAWYVMTSPANNAETTAFFRKHDYFGLNEADVFFFVQGTMPAIGLDGKLLLETKGSLALSADGHGGSLKALYRSGAIADMKKRGVTTISYFQIDNPTVKIFDTLFLGLHATERSQMSSKMISKEFGKEKLGNFCLIDGKLTVVEYSDLPDELAEQRLANGRLRFEAGSPAIHLLDVEFVEQLNATGELALPFHRADKKVPCVAPAPAPGSGAAITIKPDKANAVKLEQFVFDALPLCERTMILQTDRAEEIAFIKNAEGDDSPAASKRVQSERAARWLEAAGVKVARKPDGSADAVIELSALTALCACDLKGVKLPERIESGAKVVI
ncbi:MAG: UTP--glucose-1-phosphate uridylyltransferase [Phycisphaerales bacterium]